ncbi:MAG: hypothetical protein ACTTH5_07515 [Wolinella sp.]
MRKGFDVAREEPRFLKMGARGSIGKSVEGLRAKRNRSKKERIL